ncbi:MAG: hypothetical protein E6G35_05475 [Actinobacteria bacterium]|nr:MAG: hypothetical protein E6G35_05475 [Actinomycetota bacterium]
MLVALVAAAVAAGVWWINQGDPIPDHPPASAPKVGSCWTVSPQTARRALPWPGRPVDCAGPHTAEVYHVGQVDRDLVQRARAASGDDRTVAVNLMYAQARRACGAFGSGYLGGDWHATRVALIASWVQPSTNGFFGCAVAQAGDPGGEGFVTRTGSLRGRAGQLAVGCVTREADTVRFASCTDAHTGEFVGTYIVTPNGAPFDARAVTAAVTRGCGQVTLSYLGLSADASRPDLHVGYVGPTTAATWLGSDQTFACYASADAPVRGTVRSLGTRPLPR